MRATSSPSRRTPPPPPPAQSPHTAAWPPLSLLLLLLCSLQLAAGECPLVGNAESKFLDPATPVEACTKRVCVGTYEQCCGGNPNACASGSSGSSAATENLQLVFSDEFESYEPGVLGTADDPRWTAMDFHYSSDKNEWQNYKPENLAVEDGKLLITLEDRNSSAIRHQATGPDEVWANKTSGMVQGWNKFCFTGGYVEFSVQLPGDAQRSGFWAAAWLMGNLGRAGYYPSLEGMWPFSYDACASGSEGYAWNNFKTQRVSKCNTKQGRGAPEIDVLEYGMLGSPPGPPQFVHTMQMGPVAPPFTSWMLPESGSGSQIRGIKLPGKQDSNFQTQLGDYLGSMTRPGFPRTGSNLTDTYTGSSFLRGDTFFTSHHKYAVLWEPGEYVRWYLDDQLLFEVNKEALRKQTNLDGLTVEQRLIPYEPSYLIMNLAMSNNAWAKVDPDLTYPGVMSVDYVRVWQRPGAISVGCDTPRFPTSQLISCNRHLYVSDADKDVWKFDYCSEFRGQENQFLLGLGVSFVAVAAVSAGLMLAMRRAYARQEELAAAPGSELPPGITPARTPQERCGGCQLNRSGPELHELLKATRPDLLAVAEAKGRRNS